MRILMVGSGGREHALIRKLKESPRCEEIYCAPGNGGISKDAVCVDISAEDIDGIAAFAKEKNIDLVFVAPDDPLAAGMVDALEQAGIRAFGPKMCIRDRVWAACINLIFPGTRNRNFCSGFFFWLF